MPKSTFADYVVNDLLSEVDGVRARAMFGGYGIYKNDTMFAIIVDDELYYKVDDSNRSDFESRGSEPFRYKAKGRKLVTMSHWKLPVEILDDRELLLEWTEKAVRVALSANQKRKRPGNTTLKSMKDMNDKKALIKARNPKDLFKKLGI